MKRRDQSPGHTNIKDQVDEKDPAIGDGEWISIDKKKIKTV